MLRIRHKDMNGHNATLVLQGRIVAEWANLLERECESLIRSGFHVVLDLFEVVVIGRSGLEVLGRLDLAGVELINCSPLIAAILEQEGITATVSRGNEPAHTNGNSTIRPISKGNISC